MVERMLLVFMMMAHIPASAYAQSLPPDEAYVRVDGSNLTLAGERVRYWGFIGGRLGGGPEKADPAEDPAARAQRVANARRGIDLMVQRIHDLGFNLHRSWEGQNPDTNPMLFNQDYEVGDGSESDQIAYAFHKLDEKGIKLWMSSTNRIGTYGPDDVDVIDDPATRDAWREAMAQIVAKNKGNPISMRSNSARGSGLLRLWDPRVEALAIQRYRMLADFPNKYKGGMRLGDDPQVVVWEISNEEFPFRGLYNGRWKDLPPFFLNSLYAKWNGFLRDKYGSEEKLKAAWGFLLPDESLEQGTIKLAPLASASIEQPQANDFNPDVLRGLQAYDAQLQREQFNRQRGADVSEFFIKLVVDHKQRIASAMRQMGKSCRLSPIVFDSGNDFRIQAAYMHQFADAVSTCSYSKGMGHDPHDRRFPFYSALDHPPKTGWTYPWFEQSTAEGKPHFVYETMVDVRTKYRAEYPMMVAALASIHDWDIICWHSFSGKPKGLITNPNPFDDRIAIWHDYLIFRSDEVLASAMKAAGEIFKNRLVDPVRSPTTFVFGARSLYEPEAMDYGKSYGEVRDWFTPTAYRYGVQTRIDPTRQDDEVIGPAVRPNVYESQPIRPTEQIAFDAKRGHLMFDSPAVASYTGFFADYGKPVIEFSSGVRFSGVQVVNPENMPYPVKADEQYVALTLATADGKPLAETKRAVLSAVSTSFNTGYELDLTRSSGGRQDHPPREGLREFWGAHPKNPGSAPVLVARVGVTVEAPQLAGMKYTLRDWHMRPIGEGVVEGGSLVVPADQPVYLVDLTRE
jgi:hypothetical protein